MSDHLTDDHLSLLERALANIGGSHYTEAWNRALAVLDRLLGREGAQ